jgi:hypothetical protein
MIKLKEIFKKNKTTIIVLASIFLVGIFLRTYHYSDWLSFGRTQVRDAWITQGAILDHYPLPLLGPKAEGTDFNLGPAFYYMQYLSASIFGTAPDKVAYPDLLFSILAMPLIFLLLKKYFSNAIALSLTALHSVSYVAVQSGRFAWNPNSVPFFAMLFLYSFLKISNPESKYKYRWATVTGIALGIGIQLHTLYLIIFPLALFIFSAYLIKNKSLKFKYVVMVFFVAFILNIPQLVSEVQTGGKNTQAFFAGIARKPKSGSIISSVVLDSEWHFQGNLMLLTPFGDMGQSDYAQMVGEMGKRKWLSEIEKNASQYAILIGGALFSIGGYVLLGYFLKKETDKEKKKFLQLVSLLVVITFLVFIPLSRTIELRYFYVLAFVPFLLLGLIMKFFTEKYGQRAMPLLLVLTALLCLANIFGLRNSFNVLASNKTDLSVDLLGEEKFAVNFIKSHLGNSQQIYLLDEENSVRSNIWALQYLLNNKKVYMLADEEVPLADNAAYFSFFLKDNSKTKKIINSETDGYDIADSASYGRFTIAKLEKH